jgi:type III pantothenate kinase
LLARRDSHDDIGGRTMLLAIEVGNSNTVFGLYPPDRTERAATYRFSTARERMPDDWFALLSAIAAADGRSLAAIDRAILSSVVPGVTTSLVEMARGRLGHEPLVVTPELDLGFALLVDEPKQVGADRLVDCVAAKAKYGGPAIIVDLGTATTFDVVDADGNLLGGSIAAGVATSLKALAANAAQLFNVELRQPDGPIGRNTVDQLRIGLVLGHQLMMEGMIRDVRAALGADAPAILTGGLAYLFAGRSPLFTYADPDLTLDGLRLIDQRLR